MNTKSSAGDEVKNKPLGTCQTTRDIDPGHVRLRPHVKLEMCVGWQALPPSPQSKESGRDTEGMAAFRDSLRPVEGEAGQPSGASPSLPPSQEGTNVSRVENGKSPTTVGVGMALKDCDGSSAMSCAGSTPAPAPKFAESGAGTLRSRVFEEVMGAIDMPHNEAVEYDEWLFNRAWNAALRLCAEIVAQHTCRSGHYKDSVVEQIKKLAE